MHKNHILVDTFQLPGTVSQKQKLRSQKARLIPLVTFLDPGTVRTTSFMVEVFNPILADVGVYALGFKVRIVPLT